MLGRNNRGQLGYAEPETDSFVARQVPELEDMVQVVAGDEYTCARRRDEGCVLLWQQRQWDARRWDADNFPVPEAVVSYHRRIFIAGGKAHVCAEAAGGVYCWGSNAMEQLGFERWMPSTGRATRVLQLRTAL